MRTMALTEDAVLAAADVLRSGGTVVYPTETAYALGADPLNEEAVKKVFLIKGRNDKKPMGLIAASKTQVEELCQLSPEERVLMDEHWPGPLSLVLQTKALKDSERSALAATTAGSAGVSVRVSSNSWARQLAETFGRPIIATSANRSGQANVFSMESLMKEFSSLPRPDLILDGGTLTEGPMSTVVRVVDGEIEVLREGAIEIRNEE